MRQIANQKSPFFSPFQRLPLLLQQILQRKEEEKSADKQVQKGKIKRINGEIVRDGLYDV